MISVPLQFGHRYTFPIFHDLLFHLSRTKDLKKSFHENNPKKSAKNQNWMVAHERARFVIDFLSI